MAYACLCSRGRWGESQDVYGVSVGVGGVECVFLGGGLDRCG